MSIYTEAFDRHGIPEYMRGGIERYLLQGIPPGGFLTAVLENDLHRAVGKADDTNVKLLPNYVKFFYNEAPSLCWGHPTLVKGWIDKHLAEHDQIDMLTTD